MRFLFRMILLLSVFGPRRGPRWPCAGFGDGAADEPDGGVLAILEVSFELELYLREYREWN